jgi:hypothetical protein
MVLTLSTPIEETKAAARSFVSLGSNPTIVSGLLTLLSSFLGAILVEWVGS